jgi:phosphoribosylglycinamide formyltransferase 1
VSSSTAEAAERLPVVVLLSGSGSNFAAIVAAARAGALPVDIRAAVSDRPAAFGLERARAFGIPAEVVAVGDYPDRATHDAALAARIDVFRPALVVCAGYLRIFTPAFVAHYADRMLNIHPSLLPEFRGLDTHRRALEAAARWHGCSVHFVTDELDGGPLVAQAPVAVLPGDSVATLSARVHRAEHKLYPTVIGWFATGRLRSSGGRVILDGQPLTAPMRLENLDAES